jgi:hypothetical protein
VLRVVTLFLTAVLICIGTFVSVLSVASLEPRQDRLETLSSQLQNLKREPQTSQVKEQVAAVSWQLNDLSACENIWYEKWKDLGLHWKTAQQGEFHKIAENLASAYTDHGHFDQALQVYDMTIDYDKNLYGEKSKEVARDLNNRALCRYLKGTTLSDNNERKRFFENAIKDCRDSTTLWAALNAKQSEFNEKNNHSLAKLIERDLRKQAE